MKTRTGRLLARLARDNSGQALVEFALTVPILFIIIIGLVDFSRCWMQYQSITDAAREGVRAAVIADQSITTSDVFSRITQRLNAVGITTTSSVQNASGACTAPTGSASVVEILGCNWDGNRGVPATVTIRMPYRFSFLGPFLNWATGQSTITLSTSAVMRNE